MELEGIMLCEISQPEKDNYMISLDMWNLRHKAEDHKRKEGKMKQEETREVDKP